MGRQLIAVNELSRRLVRDLNPVLPAGVSLRIGSDDEAEVVSARWGPIAGSIFQTLLDDASYKGKAEKAIEVAARSFFSALQDAVAEEHAMPWLRVAGQPLSYMPDAQASVREGILRLWFGDEATPILPVVIDLYESIERS